MVGEKLHVCASKIHAHKSKEAEGTKRREQNRPQKTHAQGRLGEGLGRQHSERQLCLHKREGAGEVMGAVAIMAQQLPVSAVLQEEAHNV